MKTLLAAVAALLLTTGCSASQDVAAAEQQNAAAVQAAVQDAVVAAKAYGRQHLGHYLELDGTALQQEGFTPAGGITVTVYVDHFDICVSGISETGEVATATSAAPDAVAGGKCSSAKALQRFSVPPGGGEAAAAPAS